MDVDLAPLTRGAALAACGALIAACGSGAPSAAVPAMPPAPTPATAPASTSPGATGADAGSAAVGFGARCTSDDACASGVCFRKRLPKEGRGPERPDAGDAVEETGYCSQRCASDADCPTPPTGGRCGGRGMCKRP